MDDADLYQRGTETLVAVFTNEPERAGAMDTLEAEDAATGV